MSEISKKDLKEFVRIAFLCICWYIVSSSNGVLGKTILSQFPYPMTVTMVQLSSIALWSPPLMKLLDIRSHEFKGWTYHLRMLFPLAFAKFISSVLAHVSIWKVPVSYAHTVKASMPIFTVLISRLFLGTRHSWTVYFSLAPIVGGVAVATLTEVSFDLTGLTSALFATAGFAVITIFSKQALKDTGMHQIRLLHKLGQMAAIMFFPVWLLVDGMVVSKEINVDVFSLLLLDGLLHWLQNILAFTLLKLVTPLTYAVANVTKRIAVISVSLLLLKNPVTYTNLGGMFMAITGVFFYNRAKHSENKSQTTLPTTMSGMKGLNNNNNSKPPGQKPLWQDHFTFDSKVTVAKPVEPTYFFNGHHQDLRRNQ